MYTYIINKINEPSNVNVSSHVRDWTEKNV